MGKGKGRQGQRLTAKVFGIIRHIPDTHNNPWDKTDTSLDDDGDPAGLEIVGDEAPYPDHCHCG